MADEAMKATSAEQRWRPPLPYHVEVKLGRQCERCPYSAALVCEPNVSRARDWLCNKCGTMTHFAPTWEPWMPEWMQVYLVEPVEDW